MTDLSFQLPEMLVIDTCTGLHGQLSLLVADTGAGTAVTLDAAGVERMTTPGLQVICALEKSLSAQQGKLRVVNASPAFAEACTVLGFQSTYQRWSDIAC